MRNYSKPEILVEVVQLVDALAASVGGSTNTTQGANGTVPEYWPN